MSKSTNTAAILLSRDGVSIASLDSVLYHLNQAFKTIYGFDIDLSQDTPDGQRVEIFAKLIYDLQVFGKYIYENLKPDYAEGIHLDNLVRINGLYRQAATHATIDALIRTTKPLLLSNGWCVEDENNRLWQLRTAVETRTGDTRVTLHATESGDITLLPGAILAQTTINQHIQSIHCEQQITRGRAEEDDISLRLRRLKTFESGSQSTIAGIQARLNLLANIVDARVYENSSDAYDEDLKLAPHSIWCVVHGGETQTIIECIGRNKTLGTGLKGTIAEDFVEHIKRADGSTYQLTHRYRFDRARVKQLKLRFTVKRQFANEPVVSDSIRAELEKKQYYIGENVKVTELYQIINSLNKNFYVHELVAGFDGVHWNDAILAIGYDEIASIQADDIEINEII